jgi:glycosyltransferase involved in cell wall biosynthesis
MILYTADPWDSAMCVLRVRGPARQAKIGVIQGNKGARISLRRITEADIVVIQRDFPRFPDYDAVITCAREQKKPVIYEIDDLILEVPSYHVSRPAFIDVLFRILRGAVDADMVVTSTSLLQRYFSNFNPNTCLVPNLLDDSIWKLRSPHPTDPDRKPVVIGYMGGGSHLPDLEMIKPVILHLLQDYGSKIMFRFWGVQPPAQLLNHPNVEWIPLDVLNYEEFAGYFTRQESDVFIAPLLENFFNRHKSQIKFLEYSSMGVAGIYSQLEPYSSVVNHGENGFLATTLEDWETQLRQLIDLPDLRWRLAANAQETVRQNWLLSKQFKTWLNAYEQIGEHTLAIKPERDESIRTVLRIAEQVSQRQAELQMQIAQAGQPYDKIQAAQNGIIKRVLRKAKNLVRKRPSE